MRGEAAVGEALRVEGAAQQGAGDSTGKADHLDKTVSMS